MNLTYTGFNRSGAAVADTIEARDIVEASEKLRRQGVYTTEIRDAGAKQPPTKRHATSAFGHGARLKHVAMFLRQLHVLVATGTPLTESLVALERQSTDPKWKRILSDVREKVEQGASLSAAMEAHPAHFNGICRGLVAAGESGGNLDAMLERLAVLSRKQVHVRSAIIGAMIYPCLLSVVAVAVLITLLIFVLPQFSALFRTLDTPLPPTTKFLMMLSDLLRLLVGVADHHRGGGFWGLDHGANSSGAARPGPNGDLAAPIRRHRPQLRHRADRSIARNPSAGACSPSGCARSHARFGDQLLLQAIVEQCR